LVLGLAHDRGEDTVARCPWRAFDREVGEFPCRSQRGGVLEQAMMIDKREHDERCVLEAVIAEELPPVGLFLEYRRRFGTQRGSKGRNDEL
jgi:hypothetical protein